MQPAEFYEAKREEAEYHEIKEQKKMKENEKEVEAVGRRVFILNMIVISKHLEDKTAKPRVGCQFHQVEIKESQAGDRLIRAIPMSITEVH